METLVVQKTAFAGSPLRISPAFRVSTPSRAVSVVATSLHIAHAKDLLLGQCKVSNLWGWVDASCPKPKSKGLYQLTKTHGANVDGYSSIYTSDDSSLPTRSVYVGDKDLCQHQRPKRNIFNSSVKTVGKSTNIVWQECMVKKEERQKLLGQKGCVIWITGLSGSGKSTLACTLDHALLRKGKLSYVLDGDNVRHGLNKNLGFTAVDRTENIRRVGEVAKLLVDAGIICIASVISPYREDRDACRKLLGPEEFIEVYMDFPLSLCEERDPKGLYKLARAGKIKGFTGIDDPYEAPLNCEIVMEPVGGRCPTPDEMAAQLMTYLEGKGFLQNTT